MTLLSRLLMPHWPSLYGFALGLIAANLAGRIASNVWGEGTAIGDRVGVYTFGTMAAVAVAAGIWWGVRRHRREITGELLVIFLIASFFAVLVNPLIARVDYPTLDGVFSQILIYFALLAVSGWVGFLIVMALGVDVYGRELKATKIAFEHKANPSRAKVAEAR